MEQNTTWMSEPTDQSKDYNALSVSSALPTAREERVKRSVKDYLDSTPILVSMSILTVYALLGDDLRLLCTPKSADVYFFSAACVCLLLFSLDLCLSFLYKPSYRFSFYFFLDVLATVSLVPDIGWVWELLLQALFSEQSLSAKRKNAGNSSKSASRLSRLMRIVRFIRLIRLSKLCKHANALKDTETQASELVVGRQLVEQTTKRLVAIVFVLLVLLPLFESDLYVTYPTSFEHGLETLVRFQQSPEYLTVLRKYINLHANIDTPLLYLSVEFTKELSIWTTATSPESLRFSELLYATHKDYLAIFDMRRDTRLAAGLSIAQTCLVCMVLAAGTAYFSRDSRQLVIRPLERVMKMVRQLAADPLSISEASRPPASSEVFETEVIEDTIQRVSALLAIGFGEAGREIIAENLSQSNELRVMIEGKRVSAIFGFCDIRNFTDATEVLQEGVLTFVNEVARIVHTRAERYFGAANKNIGDAFLVVWKRADIFAVTEELAVVQRRLADFALMCFLKILAQVATHSSLLKYRRHAGLRQRLPDFAVRLGCGLHYGWAIEGTIGSDLKIDASYLSPNVNMATRLESATKTYGVPLLLSGEVYDLFSDSAKNACRLLDCVTVKGSLAPVRLYTCDIDTSALSANSRRLPNRAACFEKKQKLVEKCGQAGMLFQQSKMILQLRKTLPRGFFPIFREGVEHYLNGNWSTSRSILRRALSLKANDGPSEALLAYMREFANTAPSDWHGHRELIEK